MYFVPSLDRLLSPKTRLIIHHDDNLSATWHQEWHRARPTAPLSAIFSTPLPSHHDRLQSAPAQAPGRSRAALCKGSRPCRDKGSRPCLVQGGRRRPVLAVARRPPCPDLSLAGLVRPQLRHQRWRELGLGRDAQARLSAARLVEGQDGMFRRFAETSLVKVCGETAPC